MPKMPQTFTNCPQYIESEIQWLAARTSRLAAEQEIQEAKRDTNVHGTRVGRRHKPVAAEEARRVAALFRSNEDKLRSEIDACIEASREAGFVSGLDCLCEKHDLTGDERLALLIATVPTLGGTAHAGGLGEARRLHCVEPHG